MVLNIGNVRSHGCPEEGPTLNANKHTGAQNDFGCLGPALLAVCSHDCKVKQGANSAKAVTQAPEMKTSRSCDRGYLVEYWVCSVVMQHSGCSIADIAARSCIRSELLVSFVCLRPF